MTETLLPTTVVGNSRSAMGPPAPDVRETDRRLTDSLRSIRIEGKRQGELGGDAVLRESAIRLQRAQDRGGGGTMGRWIGLIRDGLTRRGAVGRTER